MKKAIIKYGRLIGKMALMATMLNVNSTCAYWIYQPKIPKGVKELRKF